MNSASTTRPRRDAPLVRLGQGDYRRDYYPEDLGLQPGSERAAPHSLDVKMLEAELIDAALRYVAVADWFEQLPLSHHDPDRERRVMDIFNRIEAELRQAGGHLLRRLGHRGLVLNRALVEVAES